MTSRFIPVVTIRLSFYLRLSIIPFYFLCPLICLWAFKLFLYIGYCERYSEQGTMDFDFISFRQILSNENIRSYVSATFRLLWRELHNAHFNGCNYCPQCAHVLFSPSIFGIFFLKLACWFKYSQ